jgi:hypothetical protein
MLTAGIRRTQDEFMRWLAENQQQQVALANRWLVLGLACVLVQMIITLSALAYWHGQPSVPSEPPSQSTPAAAPAVKPRPASGHSSAR